MKRIIITADDFGSSLSVNAAVERAHREGVLNTASLMVGGVALDDALERASRLPDLQIGLHLALVNASPVAPLAEVANLVDSRGRFPSNLVTAGIRYFFNKRIRHQLAREIQAQFEAFRETGLALDHANSHNHMHLHPTVGRMLIRIGKTYGLKAVRYPCEPLSIAFSVHGSTSGWKCLTQIGLMPWLTDLKRNIVRAGLKSNRFIFGMRDSGRLTLPLLCRFLEHLPDGVTEFYFRPGAAGSETHDELSILTSPVFQRAIESSGAEMTTFSELVTGYR